MGETKSVVSRRLHLHVSGAIRTIAGQRDAQKHIVPVDSNITANPTKNGPAAPVNLSPIRSNHLQQWKTCRAQIIYVRGRVSYGDQSCTPLNVNGIMFQEDKEGLTVVKFDASRFVKWNFGI
jgi:hypothetical protein